jgi:hypothetical protein
MSRARSWQGSQGLVCVLTGGAGHDATTKAGTGFTHLGLMPGERILPACGREETKGLFPRAGRRGAWGSNSGSRRFISVWPATSKNWGRAIPEYRGAISRERDHAGSVVRSWDKRSAYSGNKAARPRQERRNRLRGEVFGFGAMCHEHSPLPHRGGEWGHSCRPDVPRAGMQEWLCFLTFAPGGPALLLAGVRGDRHAGQQESRKAFNRVIRASDASGTFARIPACGHAGPRGRRNALKTS